MLWSIPIVTLMLISHSVKNHRYPNKTELKQSSAYPDERNIREDRSSNIQNSSSSFLGKNNPPTLKALQNCLKEGVTPLLEADGGGIDIIDYEYPKLRLNFTGSCDGCGFSASTFTNIVKSYIFETFPNSNLDITVSTKVYPEPTLELINEILDEKVRQYIPDITLSIVSVSSSRVSTVPGAVTITLDHSEKLTNVIHMSIVKILREKFGSGVEVTFIPTY